MSAYELTTLTDGETERLRRIYADLLELTGCNVPSVRASSRAALTHISQAMNGEGLAYELYTNRLAD